MKEISQWLPVGGNGKKTDKTSDAFAGLGVR